MAHNIQDPRELERELRNYTDRVIIGDDREDFLKRVKEREAWDKKAARLIARLKKNPDSKTIGEANRHLDGWKK